MKDEEAVKVPCHWITELETKASCTQRFGYEIVADRYA